MEIKLFPYCVIWHENEKLSQISRPGLHSPVFSPNANTPYAVLLQLDLSPNIFFEMSKLFWSKCRCIQSEYKHFLRSAAAIRLRRKRLSWNVEITLKQAQVYLGACQISMIDFF